MSPRFGRCLLVLALQVGFVPSALAADDGPAQAARNYELGRQAFEAERFAEAALEFEAAFQALPHAVSLFMAADAWERAGRLEQAADAWSIVPSAPGVSAEQASQADQRRRTLERLLGTVVVTSSEAASVRLDDGVARPTPARLHATAGTRTLVVLSGGHEERRAIRLDSGQLLTLPLDSPPQRSLPPPPPAKSDVDRGPARQPSWWTTPRIVGAGLLGAGAAGLAVGTGFGLAARQTKQDFDQSPTAQLREQGLSQVRWTNVGLIGGGILLLGGASLLVWAPAPEASATGASLSTRASSGGVSVEVTGRF